MGDLVGSGAVIVAAIVIATTGWLQADALASVLIAHPHPAPDLVAAEGGGRRAARGVTRRASTWTRSGRTSSRPPGVADVHDLHAWTITSGVNVVSAHVVLDQAPTRRRCSTSCAAACRATSTSSTRRSSSRPPIAVGWRSRTTPEARRPDIDGSRSRSAQAAPLPGLKTMSAMMMVSSRARVARRERRVLISARAAVEVGPSASNCSAIFVCPRADVDRAGDHGSYSTGPSQPRQVCPKLTAGTSRTREEQQDRCGQEHPEPQDSMFGPSFGRSAVRARRQGQQLRERHRLRYRADDVYVQQDLVHGHLPAARIRQRRRPLRRDWRDVSRASGSRAAAR